MVIEKKQTVAELTHIHTNIMDARFSQSPLMIPMMHFSPKVRVAMQVIICFALFSALYACYYAVPLMLGATEWSGYEAPKDAEVSGWFLLLMPIIAVIPGIYIFTFLKYNFNH